MGKGNTAELIQAARQLGTLEERRKQLGDQIKEIDETIRALRLRLEGPVQVGGPLRGELVDAVLQHVVSAPDREFTAEGLAQALGKAPPSVRGALSRLFNEGRIARPRRGLYRAKGD